ncbi:twin-arginine translocation signal domain-containing protein [Amycolatopsis sp. NPDC089917]|uniref:twin-arginine translocation signal domain-containing protein n=1 Tax=Amycolatopsis sp. NPDC089917 TaxID=3155187 RepID=UPI00343FA898
MSRIERSTTRVRDLEKLERWSYALHVPDRCLWFERTPQAPNAYRPTSDSSRLQSSAIDDGSDVQRRDFLKKAGTGALVLGSSLFQAQGRVCEIGKIPAGNPDVETIKEMTKTFRRLDNLYGGGRNRSALESFLTSSVSRMLKESGRPERTKFELFGAAAEMHQLAGWMAHDVGQAKEGRRHLREALRLTQESGNDALSGEMLAGMSHHAAFYGSAESAVDLALAARQDAKRSGLPALIAESAVMEAHGLAMQGDKPGALAALRTAEQVFDRASKEEQPAWLSYFDEAYMAAKFAHTFRDLDMPQEAELFAHRSLEMSEGYERGRLFNTALLASILADQRRIEEACRTGGIALDMTLNVRSTRSSAYLARIGQRLAPFRSHATVQGFYEKMESVGLPTPSV